LVNLPAVAVVGSRKSGKTATVEILVRGLTERGYRVATAKHIPEAGFTIDTAGKDTWRHAEAGARTVVSVAPKEVAVIKKVDTTKYDLGAIIEEFRNSMDIIVLEGFSTLIAKNPHVAKIVAIKANEEIPQAFTRFEPILAFAGSTATKDVKLKISYVDREKEPDKLIQLVEEELAHQAERGKKADGRLEIEIAGKPLPINPFVQRIIGNSLLAMISTLKKVEIKGDPRVSIRVEEPI
jgi:molybdopterin-guanine dinucleotide biosynthesis protein B